MAFKGIVKTKSDHRAIFLVNQNSVDVIWKVHVQSEGREQQEVNGIWPKVKHFSGCQYWRQVPSLKTFRSVDEPYPTTQPLPTTGEAKNIQLLSFSFLDVFCWYFCDKVVWAWPRAVLCPSAASIDYWPGILCATKVPWATNHNPHWGKMTDISQKTFAQAFDSIFAETCNSRMQLTMCQYWSMYSLGTERTSTLNNNDPIHIWIYRWLSVGLH